MKYVLTIVTRAPNCGGGTWHNRRGLNKNRDKLKWHGCMSSFCNYLLLSMFINISVPCVCTLFTPDKEFLAALLCLCSISHCWRGWKTKMHLDRGHLTWPQTRRNLAAAAPQFTIRINPVILQNHPSYTKAVYKVQLTWSVSTLPCVYTSSETDIVLTTWHNVTSHHQTQGSVSRVRHHYLIILYPSLNTSFQS